MASTFQFELVSPEKLILSKPAAMVTVPGGEGDYGVLPGHAPLITTVKPGVIEVFTEENGAATDRLFVSGGFAEVTQTRCTVLATEAMPVANLNRATLEDQARAIADQLSSASADEKPPLLLQQAVVTAKLQAAA
jgi:F-type H+-transporting ATPase subunit epsilon